MALPDAAEHSLVQVLVRGRGRGRGKGLGVGLGVGLGLGLGGVRLLRCPASRKW